MISLHFHSNSEQQILAPSVIGGGGEALRLREIENLPQITYYEEADLGCFEIGNIKQAQEIHGQ